MKTTRAGSQLNIKTRLLHGIHNERDVAALPAHRKAWLLQAAADAETIVSMALKHGQVGDRNADWFKLTPFSVLQYRTNFKFGKFHGERFLSYADPSVSANLYTRKLV